jgi:hypothetical protein
MDLPNIYRQLEANPALIAWRPRGIFINMTAGGVLIRVAIPKPYRWHPTRADVIATDWSFGTMEQAQKAGEEIFGAAAGQ